MAQLEQLEMQAHRAQLEADVRGLIDKFLAISEWDVPEINEPLTSRLIIAAIRQTLDRVDQALPLAPPS